MESTARLLIRIGSQPEQEYTLTQEVTILGREAINDLVINDAEVSRRHSRIMLESEGFMIEDLGSTNGTFVNGQRVTAAMVLYHGDTIELGKSARLVFLGSAPRDAAQPPAMQGSGELGAAAPIAPVQQPPSQPDQEQYEDYAPYEPYEAEEDPYDAQDQYYGRPQNPPPMLPQNEDYDEYDDDDDEAGGCQRYFITCGCLVLLVIFLLFAALFILDQIAPDALYCGPLQNFWNATLGPLLEALGRPLTCPPATP